ncbi:hypothetical protein D3C86_1869410 [compost metagenome]
MILKPMPDDAVNISAATSANIPVAIAILNPLTTRGNEAGILTSKICRIMFILNIFAARKYSVGTCCVPMCVLSHRGKKHDQATIATFDKSPIPNRSKLNGISVTGGIERR